MKGGNNGMNNRLVRFPVMFATLLLALPLWMVSKPSDEPGAREITGEVTDSICAKSGSHDEMMAKMQSMGRDKETCTRKCAEMGAKYVLFDEANKAAYIFDDQEKAKSFAGHRVKVEGTLAGNRIKVTNVEAVG
jgi:hypothetical protein